MKLKMINLIKYRLIFFYLFFLLNLLFFNEKIESIENKILFKINEKTFTSIDLKLRENYLKFVGNNKNLSKEIIIDDFISANLFYEHYKTFKNKLDYDAKIIEIFENIKVTNEINKKVIDTDFNKENILFNIKLDYIRKIILEKILNSNLNDLGTSRKEIDLLYNFKIKYINFSKVGKENIIKFNSLNKYNVEDIIKIFNENNINFFMKEEEIKNINNINKVIKDKILLNEKNFFIRKNNNITLIFIEKKFETFEGLIADIYSIRTNKNIDTNSLKCDNLLKLKNNFNIANKEYKFSELNNELKKNLVNINDYVKFIDNNENIYVILCNLKFDEKILNNFNLNKLINLNVKRFEKELINQYSKIYNLIRINV
tara:strand:+ start:185 stop:1300 length:1116 start_codon:yes stop_codon:yes gene_type:complete